jgi:DNA processing protein
MNSDLVYRLALCDVPHIGNIQAKFLCEQFENARDIFNAKLSTLQCIEGIGEIRARSIKNFRGFNKAEKEIQFISRYGIRALFFKDADYPRRLLNCCDPPLLLFYKGNADLNSGKIISIAGTRRHSEYGKSVVEALVKEMAAHNVLIVSGLAYGIDSLAHRNALKNNLATIGVIAHGMDTIYPPQNTSLAKEMLALGGILTEFKSNTSPDKYNFPSRNRIVAGMSDATIIVESGEKGGSMITAEIANGYNKDVFAVPGKIFDTRSNGCNELIRMNKAILLNHPAQIAETLGWNERKIAANPQTTLFTDLDDTEKRVVELLQQNTNTFDELNISLGVAASRLASVLLNLELKNLVEALPGKKFRLVR